MSYSASASPASGGDYGQPGAASSSQAAGAAPGVSTMASTIAHAPATPATTPGVRAKKRRKPKTKTSFADNMLGVVAWIIALLLFFPIFWMAITAFKSEGQAYSTLLLFTPTLESFSEVFARSNYFAFAWNSILISLGVTVICLIIAVPAAYAMAFFPTKKTQQILLWMLSTKMMPSVGVLIPIYVLWKNAGLLDTVTGLVIVYTLMNLPIAVWMAYTYFCEIPRDILEAGRIDGAMTWQEIVFLLVPMSLPGVASTALLLVIMSWNEAFWSINLSSSHAAPLTVFIASYSSPEGLFWAKLSAASLLAVAPILIVGWVSQKQLVRGLTFGAVK
ncbi:sorbitol/mannitol transport system permease protein [Pararobbsia alpina]